MSNTDSEKARVVSSPIIQSVLDSIDPKDARIVDLEMQNDVLQSERDYWRIRAGSAEDYIEALWGFIEDPSETNRIHAECRKSEWMSYVESPEGIK